MGKISRPKGAQNKIIRAVHPGSENLIPFNKRSKEEARAIQSKGGKTRSPLKSLSAKLQHLKSRGMTDEAAAKIYEIMTDTTLSALDIRMFLEKLKPELRDVDEKLKMGKMLLDWHKSRHGSGDTNNTEINIDNRTLNIDMKEIERLVHNKRKEDNEEESTIDETDGL